jgi:hypothetical protein
MGGARTAFVATAVLLVSASCTANRAADTSPSPASLPRIDTKCPTGVLYRASALASASDVLRAAERILARQTLNTQGHLYHLTPRNAPIKVVEQLGIFDPHAPGRDVVPGLAAIYRAAVLTCGPQTAGASWAVYYPIAVSVIASAGGYSFLTKTRTGWRFWGFWCGAQKPVRWRNTYCP